ncbi:MerR family transcriptional regulator [Lactococcus piscium]|jgi:DNA-binding transcriptional MerR regulator|uniref:MerR family transcriptional regulator n=1 Tax=Pseudolactococcus carnosus TaxID=2749961 RepID=UPI000BDC9EE9|nr:MerR family transcriptional regulator [Lactococcus carnosus]MBR6895496.1 MerR family transcriptional regulator [Lactococcus sp.]SOB47447.1 Transcriptional regulator, MerR family [Lactococcus piscium]MCJ1972929.1 MerR family transcriptional regulator [Lactococcus carnosus]MCJ1974649.1 MerR family transcriptional regulator [Lactococcus carnosus]MCJ1978722.1 MerR family transcriptional regulator [Lactococcus carnosus]
MFIKEFSEKTGLSIDTLRYYENENLLAPKRNQHNYRDYTESDVCWVELLLKMKQTGMSINEIKGYAALQEQGDVSLANRIDILDKHLTSLKQAKETLEQTMSFVERKISGYKQRLH